MPSPAKESPYAKALTVYLLIEEITDPLNAISSEASPDHLDILDLDGSECILCIRNKQGRRPDWTKFFASVVGDITKFGTSSSVSALLLVPQGGRVWALTFGHGRSMLQEGIIEDRFGLQTALNAIDSEKVRAIDKETFDSFAAQARQQATTETEFGHFGIDVDRDLLYAVAGVPRDARLGRRLAGKDALCASVKVSITQLCDYLGFLLDVYSSKAYQADKRFAWVDNIYEVRDKAKKRELDAKLVERLRKGTSDKAWLALPEIIDWQRAKNFSYANPSSGFTVEGIHLKTFMDAYRSKRDVMDVVSLKRAKVICFGHNEEELHQWSVYRCLYAEVKAGRDVFLLTNAHWYKVNWEIVEEVSKWFDGLTIDDELMPSMMAGEWEDDYNKRIARGGGYTLFHGNTVYMPANRGGIEFCDMACFCDGRCDLVHVKRYGRSNKLSHLFYQGLNSAKLFRTSPEFRKVLGQSIDDPVLSAKFVNEPSREEYRVVYAIASSSTSKFDLPLFSKLSLRQALRDLNGLGFRTMVAKIPIPPEERTVKRIKGVRKTF